MGHSDREERLVPLAGILGAVALLVGVVLGAVALPSLAQDPPKNNQTAGPSTFATGLHEGSGQPGASAVGRASGRQSESNGSGTVNLDLALQSAMIESHNLHETEEEFVVYRFGRFIRTVDDPAAFGLQGYNVQAKVLASSARLVEGDPTSVLVGFAAGTDLSRFTIATVAAPGVRDEAGKRNLPGSVALEGSAAGSTAGDLTVAPDLVEARTVTTLDRIVYTFDAQLDEQAKGDASKVGFSTLDGTMVPATSLVATEGNTVTAGFSRPTEAAVAFYALPGAVKDRQGLESTLGSIGAPTTAPDLVAVSNLIGRTQLDYTFDALVTDVEVRRFVVYALNGTKYTATGFARPSATVVRVALPEMRDFADQMVLAGVEAGAVKADDGSDVPSTVGTRRIGTLAPAAGLTSGPDLTSVSVDRTTGQILFAFDRAVDDDQPYDPRDFQVVTAAGEMGRGRFFVEVVGNRVLIAFDPNVAAAAGAVAIAEGAVKSFQGEQSPARSLRL